MLTTSHWPERCEGDVSTVAWSVTIINGFAFPWKRSALKWIMCVWSKEETSLIKSNDDKNKYQLASMLLDIHTDLSWFSSSVCAGGENNINLWTEILTFFYSSSLFLSLCYRVYLTHTERERDLKLYRKSNTQLAFAPLTFKTIHTNSR